MDSISMYFIKLYENCDFIPWFFWPICRHVIASLHFNENVKRDAKVSSQENKSYRVMYPKYKLGEEVVREVTIPPTYDM